MTFQPQHALAPETNYRVVFQSGLQDDRGRANQAEIQWLFRTRRPQLLLVGTSAITITEADGTQARTVVSAPLGIGGVAVAPNGQQVVYGSQQDAQRSALELLNLADDSTRPLVDSPEMSADAPAWSPGGDMIAFERRIPVSGALGPPHVWVAQPDGTLLGPLDTGQAITSAPAWSPNGSGLSFTSAPSQTLDMFTFKSDHRSWPASTGEPASWAPTGAALVYSGSDTTPGDTRIRRVDTTSLAPPVVLSGATANESSPAWSPDGQWIAYIQSEATGGSTLWLMRPDGTQREQLTSPSNSVDQRPVWSPDSRHLAFIRLAPLDGAAQSAAWTISLADKTARQVYADVQQVFWLP